MAEIQYSKHVSEIPAGHPLPTYERHATTDVTPFANLQAGISQYAEASNWMSSIGSSLSARASNAIAERLGSELGKNPQGDIGIPLTDFDAAMHKSYDTQAQATLGLQASKLITDSNIEMAKANRITPALIDKTNQSISIGLKNIFKNAPASIIPNLESHYGNLQLSQTANLTERMLREQKEDTRNNVIMASQLNAEQAHSFGREGNDKAALAVVENTKKINEAQVATRVISPATAKEKYDTARKSYLKGKMEHDYEIARAQGKSEEYLKSIADKKPSYLSDSDYMDVTNNLMQYVNHQQGLRSQDEQLRLAQFSSSVALNPTSPDTFQQLQDLKENVSAIAYEKANVHYLNALNHQRDQGNNVYDAIKSWGDPSSYARLTEKTINRAFDMQVGALVSQREKQGNPISQEEAEVQVAVSAGGKVPVFVKELENKLVNGNPVNIESGARQIDLLNDMEAGRVYTGLSQKAKAIATQFGMQRGSMPDTDLARKITDNISNIDEPMQKTLDNTWSMVLTSKGVGGINNNRSMGDMALMEVGLIKGSKKYDGLGGTYFGVLYGNDIYNQLQSNFMSTRGDYAAALKMTKDYVDTHYGDTYVNGSSQKTDSPVERFLGYKGRGATPFIQQDILNQFSIPFAESKKAYPDDYWEVGGIKNGTATAIRHVQTDKGLKTYHYPINLVGRAGNQWDVVVQTPYGVHNLFLIAPHLGITSYQPDAKSIQKNYLAHMMAKPSPEAIHPLFQTLGNAP